MFSEKLVELRTKAEMSQGALAAKVGLSRQAISYLESEKNEPSWETVQRLALALGVDYGVFADPGIKLPQSTPPKPPGRPKGTAEPKKPARRKKT